MVPAAPSRRTDAGSAIAGAVPHALGYAQDLAVRGHARGLVIAAGKTIIPGGRSRPGVTRRAYRNFRAYLALKDGACARPLGQRLPGRPAARWAAGWGWGRRWLRAHERPLVPPGDSAAHDSKRLIRAPCLPPDKELNAGDGKITGTPSGKPPPRAFSTSSSY